MTERGPLAEFEIWQDGQCVAEVEGPLASALAEVRHYCVMYGPDGPVAAYIVSRSGRRKRRAFNPFADDLRLVSDSKAEG